MAMNPVDGEGQQVDFYAELGVPRIINASTAPTALGGTLMPSVVLRAMESAAGAFVDMHELHLAAGQRLAAVTRNEAAYVTASCASALVLATLACRTRGDPRLIEQLPQSSQTPDEVVSRQKYVVTEPVTT
jgi:D-glucosaminate-6-phosphate ammonia-lyase